MVTHEFAKSFKDGEQGELFLDGYFSMFYDIKPVTDKWQRSGIDRVFSSRMVDLFEGAEYLAKEAVSAMRVEYKSDSRAAETRNAFIETVSVDSSKKQGWIYTSRAHLLIYFVPPMYRIYCCPMLKLREHFAVWEKKYRTTEAENNGYRTYGVLVPLPVFEKAAIRVVQL